MIVAMHQPAFLPWLGYLHRMSQADLFIVLDHLPFERGQYQNRTRIRLDGHGHWLSVPVRHQARTQRLDSLLIANAPLEDMRHWGAKHCRTLGHAYRDAPYLADYLPELREILDARWSHLIDLDLELLAYLRAVFDIHTPLIRSSQLGARQAMDSALVIELCRSVGADSYLGGMGSSRNFLDSKALQRAGIELIWQDFRPPFYRQCGEGFIAGLSAFDLLANQGARGLDLVQAAHGEPAAGTLQEQPA
jgi:hypothetical protein